MSTSERGGSLQEGDGGMPEPDAAMRVAVTGASGSLGRRVVSQLLETPAVGAVVALDRAPLPVHDPRLRFERCDVRDPDLAQRLAGCDSLVHLAFIVERGSRDGAETESINVGGTRNVCEAAARAGLRQIVYASSVAAYGFHADNDGVLLTEEAPIRGNPDFYYARHKAEVEHWLDGFEARHPQVGVARLRPSIFIGERSQRFAPGLRGPLHFRLPGSEARFQVTHEDDVAAAFVLALGQRARGAFNVTAERALSGTEMGDAMGKRSVRIPRFLLRLYRAAWRAGLAPIDPVWLDIADGHSLEASASKIRRELGWRPRFETTGDVLRRVSGRDRD